MIVEAIAVAVVGSGDVVLEVLEKGRVGDRGRAAGGIKHCLSKICNEYKLEGTYVLHHKTPRHHPSRHSHHLYLLPNPCPSSRKRICTQSLRLGHCLRSRVLREHPTLRCLDCCLRCKLWN